MARVQIRIRDTDSDTEVNICNSGRVHNTPAETQFSNFENLVSLPNYNILLHYIQHIFLIKKNREIF